MSSPKPPRFPTQNNSSHGKFRRSESSPAMYGSLGYPRRKSFSDNSPHGDSPLGRDLPTLLEDPTTDSQSLPEGNNLFEHHGFHQPLRTDETSATQLPWLPSQNIRIHLPPHLQINGRRNKVIPNYVQSLPSCSDANPNVSSSSKKQAAGGESTSLVDFRRGGRCQLGKAKTGAGNLNEWVLPLLVFALICLGALIATIVYCLVIVEGYVKEASGIFFHVSDVHFDPMYRNSSSSLSSCRGNGEDSPAPYGRYGCDSPLSLVRSGFRQMAAVSQSPDFILISGDSVAFNLHTADDTLRAIMQVDLEMQRAFPNPATKILYAVGDSEFPVHYQGSRLSRKLWLSRLASAWTDCLKEAGPDAMATFLRGGYYTSMVNSNTQRSSAGSGPRRPLHLSNVAVVVLNTLLFSAPSDDGSSGGAVPLTGQDAVEEEEDAKEQLAWLAEELKQARHWGRKVLVTGHKPPGVKGLGEGPLWRPGYEEQYRELILEHSDVVVGQLFGYLHRDQFRLMRPHDPAPHPHLAQPRGQEAALEGSAGEGGVRSDASLRKALREVVGSSASAAGSGRSSRYHGVDGKQRFGSAILIAPSLSPALENRPSFRLFQYDRWKTLMEYTEHTADLTEQVEEHLWDVQYKSATLYGLSALNMENLKILSYSFFNASGYPTTKFEAFCRLRVAGREATRNWERERGECCTECPHHMHCSLESSTYQQYLLCRKQSFP